MRLRTVTIFSLLVGAVVTASTVSTSFVPTAGAVPGVTGKARLYFGENNWGAGPSAGIYWMNLDGTGSPSKLDTTGAYATDPGALVLDPRNGYVYWTNCGAQLTLSRAKLDGSGATDLTNTGAGGCPWGLAIDHAGQKIYYVEYGLGGLYRTNMDGSSRTLLTTTGTSGINSPSDLLIDPVSGYLYWSNDNPTHISKVSLATLAGSDIATTGVSVSSANSIVIDRTGGKIFWSDFGHSTVGSSVIGVANLDGSGSGTGITPGAPLPYSNPQGMVIDFADSKIYLASGGNITRMSMTGTGAVDIHSKSGTWVSFMAILAPPVNTVAPTVTGTASVGSTLTCGNGSWEMDKQEQKYFDAPESFSYSWLKDGAAAGSGATITAAVGAYTCLVTATNEAGTNTVASSNSVTVTNATTTTAAATTTTVAAATTVPAVTATTVATPNSVGSSNNTGTTKTTVKPTATTVAAVTAATTTTSTVPATTTTLTPVPESEPGDAKVTVGGAEVDAKISRSDNKIVVTAAGLTGTIGGITADGKPVGLDKDGNLRLTPGNKIEVSVEGLGSGAEGRVRMYSKGTDLGTFVANGTGQASGTYAIPASVADGDHTLVMDSTGADGQAFTLALGFKVGAVKDSAGVSRVILVILLLAVLLAVFIPTTLRRRRRTAASG